MKIKIDIKIVFFIVLFFITKQIKTYSVLILFVCLHEMGHLISGFILGFKPQRLAINPFGISLEFKTNYNDYNKKIVNANLLAIKRIIIALGGPAVNLVIAGYFLMHDWSFIESQKELIIYSNLVIALFNLIPIYPLDGGRIIKNTIHIFSGLEKSNTYTNTISNITMIILTIVSSFLIMFLKNIAVLLIVIYLWIIIINENKQYSQKQKIYKEVQKLIERKKENVNF